MNRRAILDTGPLVALLSRTDRFHTWAVAQLQLVEPPMISCDAVLSEACFLLRDTVDGPSSVLALVSRGLLELPLDLADECRSIEKLMSRYASVPMALADACLVRLSELNPRSSILTLDSDFRVYRRNGRQALPVIMPVR